MINQIRYISDIGRIYTQWEVDRIIKKAKEEWVKQRKRDFAKLRSQKDRQIIKAKEKERKRIIDFLCKHLEFSEFQRLIHLLQKLKGEK